MSSRTKVSKQVKVEQDKQTITFELVRKGLHFEVHNEGQGTTWFFVLRAPAMDALRELLEPSLKEKFGKARDEAKLARERAEGRLTLPAEEFDKRFEQGQAVARESDGTPTPEGLSRKADGVEEGMGE